MMDVFIAFHAFNVVFYEETKREQLALLIVNKQEKEARIIDSDKSMLTNSIRYAGMCPFVPNIPHACLLSS